MAEQPAENGDQNGDHPHEENDQERPINGVARNGLVSENGFTDRGPAPLTEGQRRYMGIQTMEQMEAIWEAQRNIEEIKNIDSQLDNLNACLDRIDHASDELNAKMKTLLETQQKARMERRTSLDQQQKELHQDQAEFDSNVRQLLANARQARKTSATPAFSADVDDLLEKSRQLRLGGGIGDRPPTDPQ